MPLLKQLQSRPSLTLALAFVLVLAMMAGIIGYGVDSLSSINQLIQRNTYEHTIIHDRISDMRFVARERTLLLSRMVHTADPFTLDELWMRYLNLAESFIKSRQTLLKQNLNGIEATLLIEQGSLTKRATAIQDRIAGLALSGRQEEAHHLLATEGIPSQDAVFEVLNELYRVQNEEVVQATRQADSTQRRARLWMMTIGVLALLLGCLITLLVVRQNHRQRTRLTREITLATTTLHSIGDAVITTDQQGHIEHINERALELLGLTTGAVHGVPLLSLLTLCREDHSEPEADPIALTLASGESQHCNLPMLLINRDGTEHVVKYTVAPIVAEGQLYGTILVFHDITELHSLTDQLQYHASHDALTGLINRREFEQQLQGVIDTARERSSEHTLCYLDLDQFKVVNDSCGHLAGDELLKQLASQLREQLRASDILARLGGDEFAVLLENCPLDKAETIADSLRQVVKEHRFTWDGKPFEIGVSIGIVPIGRDSGNIYEVLRSADTACYIAKDLGRNRIHVYQQHDDRVFQLSAETQWSQRIKQALATDAFCLHSQPVIPLHQDGERGSLYELLLRMRDSDGNTIPPMAFIPAAERYNMMPEVDRWVVTEACRFLGKHHCQIERNDHLFMLNISAQSIADPGFIQFLQQKLAEKRVNARRLCFEVTESAAIANLEASRRLISAVRGLGCRFALDDFGTGFSSFAYLKNLPVDYIKIDGNFIRDILDDPVDRLMVESIQRTAKLLKMRTVAEYVENALVHDTLQQMGIDYAQGWHVGHARPLDELYGEQVTVVGDTRGIAVN